VADLAAHKGGKDGKQTPSKHRYSAIYLENVRPRSLSLRQSPMSRVAREIGLGKFPDVSLPQARQLAAEVVQRASLTRLWDSWRGVGEPDG